MVENEHVAQQRPDCHHGFAAAVTGLVMAGRKAVQSYADMEEQMANTIKYTRMTAAEVEELNEIFKGMDTRLAREQLNLLAQEGGRLGYNTVASVKEYVEAASIINVALVDLGEGATQTIAKLSNIFGMEQMYGVKDAMLKIGSTVNHLSQNCTAAKPFIVEFAQRMAGIGSTAKMTIPEIMAFAATLDAHGQKVEMSATALQRTIMELFKKPAEMARKVGLETNSFIETLNKSTTQGVMMFLEALHRLGEDQALAVLSPLFQDSDSTVPVCPRCSRTFLRISTSSNGSSAKRTRHLRRVHLPPTSMPFSTTPFRQASTRRGSASANLPSNSAKSFTR